MSGIELDLGLQFAKNTPVNPGWKPYARSKEDLVKKSPMMKGNLWIVPDTPVRVTFFATGYSRVLDNEVKISYLGNLYNDYTKVYQIDRVVFVYTMPGWTIENSRTLSVKRINSIAQPGEKANSSQGYNDNGSYVLGAAWGYDPLGNEGNVKLIPGDDWNTTLTRNQGSFPVGPLVTWLSDNNFYIERNINLKARP